MAILIGFSIMDIGGIPECMEATMSTMVITETLEITEMFTEDIMLPLDNTSMA
jgi:hypothetical protein